LQELIHLPFKTGVLRKADLLSLQNPNGIKGSDEIVSPKRELRLSNLEVC
jgi:hypothetical protein